MRGATENEFARHGFSAHPDYLPLPALWARPRLGLSWLIPPSITKSSELKIQPLVKLQEQG